MKKIITLLVFVSFVQISVAQTTTRRSQSATVSGVLVSAGDFEPLPGAHIYLKDTVNPVAVTDEKGEFVIKNATRGNALIKSTFVGYESFSTNINIEKSQFKVDTIVMYPTMLGEVIVLGDPSIARQKGDTTSFNAGAFKVNPDATAEEMVKKVPGITVSADGKIESSGKEVGKILVDGKQFFGDDPSQALRSLSADFISEIQVFDERSDQSVFSGVDDGVRNRTINITTREPGKKKIDAIFKAGYGIENEFQKFKDNRYTLSGRVNIFNNIQSLTLIASTNNVNERDYGGRGGGGGGFFGNSGGMEKLSALGVNYSIEKGKIKFSGNYSFRNTDNYSESVSQQNYFKSERFDTRIYDQTRLSWTDRNEHTMNFRLTYNLSDRDRIIISPMMRFQSGDTKSFLQASNVQDGNTVSTTHSQSNGDNSSYNIRGNATWMHRFDKAGRTLSLGATWYMTDNRSNTYRLDSNQFMVSNVLTPSLVNQFTHNVTPSSNYSLNLTYTEPISKSSGLSLTYTYGMDNSNSERMTYKYPFADRDYGAGGVVDSTLSNVFDRKFNRQSLGLGYNYKKEQITFNANMGYQFSDREDNRKFPYDSVLNYKFYNYVPRLSFSYNKSKSISFEANYSGRTSAPSAEQLADVINNNNPLQVSVGNPNLKQSYNHELTLRLNLVKPEKSTFLNFMLSGQNTFNSIANEVMFIDRDTVLHIGNKDYLVPEGARLSKPTNLNGYYEVWSMVNYSQKLRFIKSNLNSRVFYNLRRSPSRYDNVLNYSSSNTIGFLVGITSNISSNVDFGINYRPSFNFTYNTSQSSTKYLTQAFDCNLNYIFLDGFVFNGQFTYNYQKNDVAQSYTRISRLLNLGLGKKFMKNKQAELRFSVNDVFNQNNNVRYQTYDTYVESSRTNILGRYYMLTFTYRFKSFSGGSSSQGGEGGMGRMRGMGMGMMRGGGGM